jgi:hypothetical protein
MLFVASTTLYAAFLNITDNFWPKALAHPENAFPFYVMIVLTGVIMSCACVVLWESFHRWYQILVLKKHPKAVHDHAHKGHEMPEYGCC